MIIRGVRTPSEAGGQTTRNEAIEIISYPDHKEPRDLKRGKEQEPQTQILIILLIIDY